MLDFEKMFVRIVSIAHYPKTGAVSLCEVGPKVGAKNIKEKTGYMRIKKFQRSMERKRTIAPAEWQEYIEI